MINNRFVPPYTKVWIDPTTGKLYFRNKNQNLSLVHWCNANLILIEAWARFLSLSRGKLRLCSANHMPGYWSNLPCEWPSAEWAYSAQETEKGPWWGIYAWLNSVATNKLEFCLVRARRYLNKAVLFSVAPLETNCNETCKHLYSKPHIWQCRLHITILYKT